MRSTGCPSIHYSRDTGLGSPLPVKPVNRNAGDEGSWIGGRRSRVHQWSAAERVERVHVRAMIEHQADRIRVVEDRDVLQRAGINGAVRIFRSEKDQAFEQRGRQRSSGPAFRPL